MCFALRQSSKFTKPSYDGRNLLPPLIHRLTLQHDYNAPRSVSSLETATKTGSGHASDARFTAERAFKKLNFVSVAEQ